MLALIVTLLEKATVDAVMEKGKRSRTSLSGSSQPTYPARGARGPVLAPHAAVPAKSKLAVKVASAGAVYAQ
jgi:hypothetical protein